MKWILLSIVAAGFASLLHSPSAATIIEVDCNPEALISAVNAANSTPEADILNLAPDCVYSFLVGDSTHGDSALPRITSDITIVGGGSGSTLLRAVESPDFRLIYVSYNGSLTLQDVTITGGSSATDGGGVYNSGNLSIVSSTFTENAAMYSGGGVSTHGSLSILSLIHICCDVIHPFRCSNGRTLPLNAQRHQRERRHADADE